MKFKRILAVLLCAVFAAGLLYGCGKNSASDKNNGTVENNRLIFTVNGRDVYEEDFKYIAEQYKKEVEMYYGTITDWNSEMDSGVSYGDYVLKMAKNWFMYAEAVKSQALRIGVTLTDEDTKTLDSQWEALCEKNGGEEALIKSMGKKGLTKELNDYISSVSLIADKCFTEMYGENGEKVSDGDCADKVEEDGYIMAKHILILTSSKDENGNIVQYDEEEKLQAKNRAENILDLLKGCRADELDSRFDELMKNNSEDAGLTLYPNGYLFQEGDMVTEFYDAALALKEGEYSGIVETEYGYHIIMRIPVNYDAIPMFYAGNQVYGYNYTLRYIVANSMFSANIESWIGRVELTNTEVMDNLDIESVIAVG